MAAASTAQQDQSLCVTISVPFRDVIAPRELIDALAAASAGGGAAAERWAPHLERLFAETPVPMLIRFFDRHGSEIGDLASAYGWHRSHGGVPNRRLEAFLAETRQ